MTSGSTDLAPMRLVDALRILKSAPHTGRTHKIELVCGFTPLHLETFLAAHSLEAVPAGERISIETGTFGDILTNLHRIENSSSSAAAVVIEWSDLDPRLGLRTLGGWGLRNLDDILECARKRLHAIQTALKRITGGLSLVVSFPTLALPPVANQPGTESGVFDLALRELVARCAMELAGRPEVRILNSSQLDRLSPPAWRRDPGADLISGFPYSGTHAAILASMLAALLFPPPPMKGLITDLDGTLWKGLVGEIGPAEVSWDLEHGSQIHGLYQQLLDALACQGVLLAIASKNELETVNAALSRPGLLVGMDHFHPIEAHWKPKSQSVSRILRAWGIAADCVVFIDDSPTELAEVKAVHPELECILFPGHNPPAAYCFLERIRDLFGKSFLTEEDHLRQQSLRTATEAGWSRESAAQQTESFLEEARSELTFSYRKQPDDRRPLELVNKTNQFNLNGVRVAPSEWVKRLGDSRYILQVARYADKFGELGRISVLTGMLSAETILIDTWVLSCRAFNRRIEDECLRQLFELFDISSISFLFRETAKNTPIRSFLGKYVGEPLPSQVELSRERFFEKTPRLYHKVNSIEQAVADGEYA